jgi:hypothetical protein
MEFFLVNQRMMNAKFTTVLILATLAISAFSVETFASSGQRDSMPPIFGLNISNYDSKVVQATATSGTYVVTVEDTGVMDLTGVTLKSDSIPPAWFSSETMAHLSFGETADIKYTLSIPEAKEGDYVFTIIAYGEHGSEGVSDASPVSLTIVRAGPVGTQNGDAVNGTEGTQQPSTKGPGSGTNASVGRIITAWVTQGISATIPKSLPDVQTPARDGYFRLQSLAAKGTAKMHSLLEDTGLLAGVIAVLLVVVAALYAITRVM